MKRLYNYINRHWLILSIAIGLIASTVIYKQKEKTFRFMYDENFQKYEVYVDSLREF